MTYDNIVICTNPNSNHYLQLAQILDIYHIKAECNTQIISICYQNGQQEDYKYLDFKNNFEIIKTKIV